MQRRCGQDDEGLYDRPLYGLVVPCDVSSDHGFVCDSLLRNDLNELWGDLV